VGEASAAETAVAVARVPTINDLEPFYTTLISLKVNWKFDRPAGRPKFGYKNNLSSGPNPTRAVTEAAVTDPAATQINCRQ
jgi:hypothetical protein